MADEDLNETLLKRDFFLEFDMRAMTLEREFHNIKVNPCSSQAVEGLYEDLAKFMAELDDEFIKVYRILNLFLKGVDRTLSSFEFMAPHLQNIRKQGIGDTNRRTLGSYTNVASLIESTMSNIYKMNKRYNALFEKETSQEEQNQGIGFGEEIPGETSVDFEDQAKEAAEKLKQDLMTLRATFAEAESEKANAQKEMETHPWNDHESMKALLNETEKKIREVNSSIQVSSEIYHEGETWQSTLGQNLEELATSNVEEDEKKENMQKWEDTLSEFQIFNEKLENQISNAKLMIRNLRLATIATSNCDPTADWMFVRVPPRNVSLLCALKGPVRSLANLKYSYIRRKQFRENVLLPKEYLVSEVIHLEQCKPFVTIQWPIIACIPLIKHVKKDDEAKLVVKMAEINQIRSWRNEKPLAINRQYEKRNFNVSDVLTDLFVRDIAEQFQDESDTIFLFLGFTQAQINIQKENHPCNIVSARSACLNQWKRRGSYPDAINELKEVLQNVHRNDLVAKVVEQDADVRRNRRI